MEPPGMSFVALRDIAAGGNSSAFAYRTGDLVHESNVEPDGDYKIGVDVAPRDGVTLDRPANNASQAAWAAYAVSKGANADDVADLSRAELIKQYGSDGA